MNTTQHTFSEVPSMNIPRSLFKRPCSVKTSIKADYLYPIYVDEYLPGDTVKFNATAFARLASPLLVPLMDNLYLDVFFFSVPNRLVDKDWPKIMGERTFGDSTTEWTVPQLVFSSSDTASGSLSDYFGFPISKTVTASPYYHRAYNLIWNEWFRSERLQQPVKVAGVAYDGTVTTESASDYVLLKRCKSHGYFTDCLDSPTAGQTVTMNLGGNAPVIGTGAPLGLLGKNLGGSTTYNNNALSSGTNNGKLVFGNGLTSIGQSTSENTSAYGQVGVSTDSTKSGLVASLAGVTSIDVNDLYQATALQSLFYRDATAGTRLIEIIKGHFNVDSKDLRALRPEFLGGFSTRLNVTSVPVTSGVDLEENYGLPNGSLTAFATGDNMAHFIKSFDEHGMIIGLANIRSDISYTQGLPRMFSRKTRFDFYWPELANLAEQPVLNKEIYFQDEEEPDASQNDEVFGYQERWSEYRYKPSLATGLMRTQPSGASTLGQYYTLSEYFENLPQLNSTFIESHTPLSRSIAVPTEDSLILDVEYDTEWARPMPVYSIPSLVHRM